MDAAALAHELAVDTLRLSERAVVERRPTSGEALHLESGLLWCESSIPPFGRPLRMAAGPVHLRWRDAAVFVAREDQGAIVVVVRGAVRVSAAAGHRRLHQGDAAHVTAAGDLDQLVHLAQDELDADEWLGPILAERSSVPEELEPEDLEQGYSPLILEDEGGPEPVPLVLTVPWSPTGPVADEPGAEPPAQPDAGSDAGSEAAPRTHHLAGSGVTGSSPELAGWVEEQVGNAVRLRPSLAALPSHLEPDEEILCAASGFHAGRTGVVLATDRRVMFVGGGDLMLAVPYSAAMRYRARLGLVARDLYLEDSAGIHLIKQIHPPERLGRLAEVLAEPPNPGAGEGAGGDAGPR